MVGPGILGGKLDAFTDHVDIVPTLRALLGLPPSSDVDGLPITPAFERKPDATQLELRDAFKQLQAPLGRFGTAILGTSTRGVLAGGANRAAADACIRDLTGRRDTLAGEIRAALVSPSTPDLSRALLQRVESLLAENGCMPASSFTMDDNFDDNSLDPSRWSELGVPPGFSGTVIEANQRLEISLGPGAGGAGIASRCSLTGDFDVQVDYALLSWPPAGTNVYGVRLTATDFSPNPAFGEIGSLRGYSTSGPGRPTQEIYGLVAHDQLAVTPTRDVYGKLRLVRSASTLS